jgi:hypothetical protein
MLRRFRLVGLAAVMSLGLMSVFSSSAQAQMVNYIQHYYYPYYYFPHNYWPQMSPTWPEKPGAPYMRPPAYMSYPPFREPEWRYEAWQRQSYYRGFHFWLDAF